MSSSAVMPSGRASAPARGGGWALILALVACEPDDDACSRIAAAQLWAGPPSGKLCIVDDLVVEDLEADQLTSLEQVEEIDGALIIAGSPTLTHLPELPALTRIGGALAISGNQTLAEIAGFPGLVEIGGRVYIAENPRLATIELAPRLTTVATIFIALNPELEQITGVQELQRVDGDLRIESNESLTSLEFPSLTEVGGDFVVADHAALIRLDTPMLGVVAGRWSLLDDPALESLDGGLAALQGAGDLQVERNDALTEIRLRNALEVKGSLYIVENARLELLAGADEVRLSRSTIVNFSDNPELLAVEGFAGVEGLSDLSIEANPSLLSISGFANLKTLSRRLEVIRNGALEGPPNLLPALTSASTIWIFGNPSLPTTSVEGLLSHVMTKDIPRVGDNGAEDTALDPCPWPGDGVCDALGTSLRPGTGLCITDLEDCGE